MTGFLIEVLAYWCAASVGIAVTWSLIRRPERRRELEALLDATADARVGDAWVNAPLGSPAVNRRGGWAR